MILTKAYITETPFNGEGNTFKVRVPAYEDGSNSEAIFDALLCSPPGTYYGYNKGDCVYVEFEGADDSSLSNAVILGKLYTSVPTEDSAMILANRLEVSDTVNLPEDTRINGVLISETVGTGGGTSESGGSGGDYSADIEAIKKKLQFTDWVIEQSGDRLNIYRRYFNTNS